MEQGERIEATIKIPANTTADVILKGATSDGLTACGGDSAHSAGILSFSEYDQGTMYTEKSKIAD